MRFIEIKEAWRMYRRARRVRRSGFRKYEGTPAEICRKIVDDCYDQERGYFRTSIGHFCQYYVRDFAFSCEALVDIGERQRVRKTLQYALARFEKAGRITTAINPEGEPFDYYLPSGPESIALFLYSFTHTGNGDLAKRHAWFLQREVDRAAKMVHSRTLLPKGTYSTIRDQAHRKSSCYDMVMLCVLARESHALGLKFPYTEEQLKARLLAEYWNGTYFFQDAAKQPIVVGDANVFPFWTGIIADRAMLESCVTAMRAAQLDAPFPLRYVSEADSRIERRKMHFSAWLAPDYETHSIWMHLGLAYLRILPDTALRTEGLRQYAKNIERYGTFLEVYDTDGEPLRRSLYAVDEGMLWCANYLALTTSKPNVFTKK